MREMKDSGIEWIGKIPSDWSIIRTKFVATSLSKGNGITKEDVVAGGDTPCIRYGEIYSKYGGSFDKCVTRTNIDRVSSPQYFSHGAILFAGTGELIEEIGKNIVYLGEKECLAGGDIIVMTHNQDPRFLNYALGSTYAQTQKSASKTKLKVVHISASEIGNIIIFIPEIHEQQRIADFLDRKCAALDAVIEKTRASIEEYKKLKQSVITEAVTKGVRGDRPMKDSGIEWIGEIPEEWECIQNRYLYKENVRTPEEGAIPLSLSQVDGLIATDEMKESSLKTSTYEGWKQVRLNDLVLNRFKGHLGVLYAATLEGMVSFHYGVYEPLREFDSKFFEYLYHSDVYKAILGLKSNGMTVGLQNLSNQNFYSVRSIYPPEPEQREIIDYLDAKCAEIDKLISKKEQYITELESFKKSLIYEYVTGKKEVAV